jgi:hypothetical protein
MPKSNTIQVKIVNVETGEEILRDATTEELSQMEADKSEALAVKTQEESKAAEKAALLTRIGLTEDELKTILG